MKIVFVVMCLMLINVLYTPVVLAKDVKELRVAAKQYYQEDSFKKAYNIYYKLAKIGDHYSQNKLAQMYEKGEGKEVDLTEAYAWSVLAAESGVDGMTGKSDRLLQLCPDETKAGKRAARLMHKYGKESLQAKYDKRERMRYNHKSGGCTGSKLGCSNG